MTLQTGPSTPDADLASPEEGTAATVIRLPALAPLDPVRSLPGAARSLPGVVVEHLDGEDLACHLARSGPVHPEHAARLGQALCATLTQLRAHGMTFDALAPAQIFLSAGLSGFEPKLVGAGNTDFPLKRLDEVPEGSDLQALGLLLAHAVAGRPLADADALARAPEIAPWMQSVLLRCLPGPERYANPEQLARALEPFVVQPIPLEVEQRRDAQVEGDTLGNYQLVRKLGEGSMGYVYLARHLTLGRTVALKVLRPEHARDDALVQRFFQEAKAVNQINHEHIVEIRDFVHEPGPGGSGRVYCVMELLEGQPLTEALRSGPMPIARAVRIVRQVCAALNAAHHVGVIHRDIKPDNLFLTERPGDADYVKVLDFGVAKVGGPLGDGSNAGTVAGTVVGTPMYMAPEQAAGQPVDGRTDLYALATVLYEALSGAPPFKAQTVGQMVALVITGTPPPLPARTPGGEVIPGTLRTLVKRCLEKDPARRPRSMVELSALLLPYARAGVRSRAPARWIALAAGLLAVAGAGAWIARSAQATPQAKAARAPVAPLASTSPPLVSAPPPPAPALAARPAPPLEAGPAVAGAGPVGGAHPPLFPLRPQARPDRGAGSTQPVKGIAPRRKLSRDAVVDPFSL